MRLAVAQETVGSNPTAHPKLQNRGAYLSYARSSMDRVPGFEPGGCRFKSCRACILFHLAGLRLIY